MGNEPQDGYSAMFYIMLILGIVGVLGFVLVAASAGSGHSEDACSPIS